MGVVSSITITVRSLKQLQQELSGMDGYIVMIQTWLDLEMAQIYKSTMMEVIAGLKTLQVVYI